MNLIIDKLLGLSITSKQYPSCWILLDGPGGSGKSLLVNILVTSLRALRSNYIVNVVGSVGVANNDIEGVIKNTLVSLNHKELIERDIKFFSRSPQSQINAATKNSRNYGGRTEKSTRTPRIMQNKKQSNKGLQDYECQQIEHDFGGKAFKRQN